LTQKWHSCPSLKDYDEDGVPQLLGWVRAYCQGLLHMITSPGTLVGLRTTLSGHGEIKGSKDFTKN
jgi:hypothetical protein